MSELREAKGAGKPANPVAPERVELPGTVEEGVWSLAYACTGSGSKAVVARELFERAAHEGDSAALFRRWWQEKTLAPLPADAVVAPWAVAVHQAIADQFERWGLLGGEPLLLACPGCGRVFTSRPPRFARKCGRCKPNTPTATRNPAGSRLMFSAVFYPSGPAGPQQGQSVLCAHPDCLTLFLATRSDERYCEQHGADRKAAARAGERVTEAKHRRVRFYPLGEGPVRDAVGGRDGVERELTITADGYQPRDETELVRLLGYVSLELLRVRWTG